MPGKREDYLSWSEYFMGIALLSSMRSKDPSTQVGACIANDNNRVLSQGYNGLTDNMSDDLVYWNSIGEQTGEKDKIKNYYVVHAERNAILNYYGSRQDLQGSILYVTLYPCIECTKEIIQAGIKKVVYLKPYSKEDEVKISMAMFDAAGVEVVRYSNKDFTKQEVVEQTQEIQKKIKYFSPKTNK